jgi:hypothetical protein
MFKLIKRLCRFLPILVFMVLFSYKVDPSGLFWGVGFEREASQMMLNGEYIRGYERLDGRSLNEVYAKNVKESPQVIVGGSSRVMLVDHTFARGKTFYNGANVGRDVYDLYNSYYVFEKERKEPEIFIMGLDPWLFSEGQDALDRSKRSNQKLYAQFMGEELGIENIKYEKTDKYKKYQALFDPAYFQGSVKYYFRDKSADAKPMAVDPSQLENRREVVKCPDGSIIYDKAYRNRSQAAADADALGLATQDVMARLSGFKEISPTHAERFEKFIKYRQGKNIKLIFYLPPYHPIVYDTILSQPDKYRAITQLEWYLKILAKRYDIELYGSYDPYRLGLKNEDFLDGLHLRKDSVKKVLCNMR